MVDERETVREEEGEGPTCQKVGGSKWQSLFGTVRILLKLGQRVGIKKNKKSQCRTSCGIYK